MKGLKFSRFALKHYVQLFDLLLGTTSLYFPCSRIVSRVNVPRLAMVSKIHSQRVSRFSLQSLYIPSMRESYEVAVQDMVSASHFLWTCERFIRLVKVSLERFEKQTYTSSFIASSNVSQFSMRYLATSRGIPKFASSNPRS